MTDLVALPACTHAYMRTCVHAYMRTCVHVYMCTCLHAYMPTCLHAYLPTCLHAYMPSIHAYTCAHIHTCMYACMQTCTHVKAHVKTACMHACMQVAATRPNVTVLVGHAIAHVTFNPSASPGPSTSSGPSTSETLVATGVALRDVTIEVHACISRHTDYRLHTNRHALGVKAQARACMPTHIRTCVHTCRRGLSPSPSLTLTLALALALALARTLSSIRTRTRTCTRTLTRWHVWRSRGQVASSRWVRWLASWSSREKTSLNRSSFSSRRSCCSTRCLWLSHSVSMIG